MLQTIWAEREKELIQEKNAVAKDRVKLVRLLAKISQVLEFSQDEGTNFQEINFEDFDGDRVNALQNGRKVLVNVKKFVLHKLRTEKSV